MEEKFKSGRTLTEEHRHDNYRKYNTLLKALKVYEQNTGYMNLLFRSKYTKEEMIDALRDYQGDEPDVFLQTHKDDQFRNFIAEVSLVETRCAHSCIVVRAHNYLRPATASMYKWVYHSLEEYLTEIYNRGDDFVLLQTHHNELVLKREDEFEYLAPINSAGEMVLRAMRLHPTRSYKEAQELYMMYTILANPDLYGNAKMFIRVPPPKRPKDGPVKLNTIRRLGPYASNRKYKGEE